MCKYRQYIHKYSTINPQISLRNLYGGIYGAEEDEDPERLPFTITITSRNMKYKLGTTQLDYIYIMYKMVQK